MTIEGIRRILRNAEPVTDDWQNPRIQNTKPIPPLTTPTVASQARALAQERPEPRKFILASWGEDQIAAFEERAAIIEYDGNLPREMAEFLAAGMVKDD